MASFILRPSSTINLDSYSVSPSELGDSAHLAVNEEVADGSTTRIYDSDVLAEAGETANTEVEFGLSTSFPAALIKVTGIAVTVVAEVSLTGGYGTMDLDVAFKINSASVGTGAKRIAEGDEPDGFNPYTFVMPADCVAALNNAIANNGYQNFPSMSIYIHRLWTLTESQKASTGGLDITQVYVEVTYEELSHIGICRKTSGAWKQAKAAYQKVNGAWKVISESDCKNILKSTNVKAGN